MDHDDVMDTLNDLVETCEDGKKGFTEAAEHVEDPAVKSELARFGQERARFAGELRSAIRGAGGEVDEDASAGGGFHRAWLKLRDALGGGDHAILAEAERGEDHAVSEYRDAMDKPLPPEMAELVRRQYSDVKAAHDRVRAMRDARA